MIDAVEELRTLRDKVLRSTERLNDDPSLTSDQKARNAVELKRRLDIVREIEQVITKFESEI